MDKQRNGGSLKIKVMYRVFDWDRDDDEYFGSLKEAEKNYKKRLRENSEGNWRLYKDMEDANGHWTEECLMSNRRD